MSRECAVSTDHWRTAGETPTTTSRTTNSASCNSVVLSLNSHLSFTLTLFPRSTRDSANNADDARPKAQAQIDPHQISIALLFPPKTFPTFQSAYPASVARSLPSTNVPEGA